MNKKQILNEAKKVLSTELQGIRTISRSFNDEFYQVVKTIYNWDKICLNYEEVFKQINNK